MEYAECKPCAMLLNAPPSTCASYFTRHIPELGIVSEVVDPDIFQTDLGAGGLPAGVVHGIDAVPAVGKNIFHAAVILVDLGALRLDDAPALHR